MLYNIVIVGYGEIARKAHTSAILQRNGDCRIVALVDVRDREELLPSIPQEIVHVPIYPTLQDAVNEHPECNVASICTPQQFTLDLAFEAIKLGLHVLLEKPPGDYRRLPLLLGEAIKKRDPPLSVFTAYHSSAPPGLPHIQKWLQHWNEQEITSVKITWKENVKKWHPGQDWIATREGLGVLDILFNPLSLLVHVMTTSDGTDQIQLEEAHLNRPSNWESPISGTASMRAGEVPIEAFFAWEYIANAATNDPEEIWDIVMTAKAKTDSANSSTMAIKDGGAQVYIDGEKVTTESTADYMIGPEYVNLYEIFVKLMNEGRSYIDATTPRLIQEIMDTAEWNEVDEYKL